MTLLLAHCIRASCGATSTLTLERLAVAHTELAYLSSPLQEDTAWSCRLGSIHHCIKTHVETIAQHIEDVVCLVLFFPQQEEGLCT